MEGQQLEAKQEKNKGRPQSELESALAYGESLANRIEQQAEHIHVDIETLPNDVDRKPFDEQLTKINFIQKKMRQAVLAASFLALTSSQALAQDKEIGTGIYQQEDAEVAPLPEATRTIQQTNTTLEIIKGVAEIALEQKKKDALEILKGVDAQGNKVETTVRIGKGADSIPKQFPKIGNAASLISAVIDIQKEASEAQPGYERAIAGRVAKLIIDIPTFGLGSFVWEMISSREKAKKDGTLTYEVANPIQPDTSKAPVSAQATSEKPTIEKKESFRQEVLAKSIGLESPVQSNNL